MTTEMWEKLHQEYKKGFEQGSCQEKKDRFLRAVRLRVPVSTAIQIAEISAEEAAEMLAAELLKKESKGN